ncbi:hypothetical protein AOLI_G00077460 [Acnodon oligacanthus]
MESCVCSVCSVRAPAANVSLVSTSFAVLHVLQNERNVPKRPCMVHTTSAPVRTDLSAKVTGLLEDQSPTPTLETAWTPTLLSKAVWNILNALKALIIKSCWYAVHSTLDLMQKT